MDTWKTHELRPALSRLLSGSRAPARDDLIGADVLAHVAYGFNARGGGRFKVHGIRGQVWSLADSTMIGSRREVTYWLADGQHFYAAARDDLERVSEARGSVLSASQVSMEALPYPESQAV